MDTVIGLTLCLSVSSGLTVALMVESWDDKGIPSEFIGTAISQITNISDENKETSSTVVTTKYLTNYDTSTSKYSIMNTDTDSIVINTSYTFQMFYNVTAPICNDFNCGSEICFCDRECVLYGDCCYSAIVDLSKSYGALTNITGGIMSNLASFSDYRKTLIQEYSSCVTDKKHSNAFWMVTKCPPNQKKEQQSHWDLCTKGSSKYGSENVPIDFIDTMGSVATYKNAHCALCHGVDLKMTTFWKIKVFCGNITISITDQTTLSDIENVCTVELFSEVSSPRRCTSTIETKQNELYTYMVNDVSTEMKILCYSYVYYIIKTEGQTMYQNPHCAAYLSNDSMSSNFTCDVKHKENAGHESADLTRPIKLDLSVIFNFNPEYGITTNVKCNGYIQCEQEEIFDCISKTCRKLYCPPGEIAKNEICIKQTNSEIDLFIYTPVDHSNITNEMDTVILEFLLNGTSMEQLEEGFVVLNKTVHYFISSNVKFSNIIHIETRRKDYFLRIAVQVKGNKWHLCLELVHDIYESLPNGVHLQESSARNYESEYLLDCDHGEMLNDKNAELYENDMNTVITSEKHLNISAKYSKMKIRYAEKDAAIEQLFTCIDKEGQPNLGCPMVAYNNSEVYMVNKTIYVRNSTLIFKPEQYAIHKGNVFVCSEFVAEGNAFINLFEYSTHFWILSVISSSLSIVALLTIMIMHCIFRRLRNSHGLNLTALSSSMLIMYGLLLLQALIPQYITGTICVIFAIVLHFFILMMFVWMNIIALDMARLFRSNNTVNSSNILKKFRKYVFVSVSIPGILISVSMALNSSDHTFSPGYGKKDVCWLTNVPALLAFFACPIAVSSTLNYILFIFIIVTIQKKRFSVGVKQNGGNSFCIAYIKLTVILGLTWLVGILSAFVRVESLWVVHIVLNGLQGVILFLCYILNARVITNLRKRGSKYTRDYDNTKRSSMKSEETTLGE